MFYRRHSHAILMRCCDLTPHTEPLHGPSPVRKWAFAPFMWFIGHVDRQIWRSSLNDVWVPPLLKQWEAGIKRLQKQNWATSGAGRRVQFQSCTNLAGLSIAELFRLFLHLVWLCKIGGDGLWTLPEVSFSSKYEPEAMQAAKPKWPCEMSGITSGLNWCFTCPRS